MAHDVKFGGYVEGTFAAAKRPSGRELEAMVHVLAADMLARRYGDPGIQYDLISVTVELSTEPPTHTL